MHFASNSPPMQVATNVEPVRAHRIPGYEGCSAAGVRLFVALFAFILGLVHEGESPLVIWLIVMGFLACAVLLLHLVIFVWFSVGGNLFLGTACLEVAVNSCGLYIYATGFKDLGMDLRVGGGVIIALNFLWGLAVGFTWMRSS